MRFETIKSEWFSMVSRDVVAGVTVAFALIPEAIAFSMVAGVNPMVGLYGSFIIGVVVAFFGGRTGMISGATGSTALLMVLLVKDHGVQYLFATGIMVGLIQLVMGYLRLSRFIRFVPVVVITGFVNALAILIFLAQLPRLEGAGLVAYGMVAATLMIVYGLPRLIKGVPAALAAVVLMTVLTVVFGWHLQNVGDIGHLVGHLPYFHIPRVPMSFHTLAVVFPYAVPIAVVGSLETLLTATVVDDMTATKSDKDREIRGQGIANLATGFFGAMAGSAMIGQTIISVELGGRKRLATFIAGGFLITLIVVLRAWVSMVPVAALVGVMFMVATNTFEWKSLRDLHKIPRFDAVVMISTVATVVVTNDLALGVLLGVILSAVGFGWQMTRIHAEIHSLSDGTKVYVIRGQMFFGTMMPFVDLFDVAEDPDNVILDFRHSHVWDHAGVIGIQKVVEKYRLHAKTIEIRGLNAESADLMQRLDSLAG